MLWATWTTTRTDLFTLTTTDVDPDAKALSLTAHACGSSMELQFLAVHEEGASQMIQRRDKVVRVVLILQSPRVLLRRVSEPDEQPDRETTPPTRIPLPRASPL